MPTRNVRYRLMLIGPMLAFAILLAACAGASAPASGTTSGTEGAAPAADGAVTLTIWDFGGVDFEWLDAVAIPRFQESHPDIQFEHVGVPESELPLKLETAIAAGQVPDLVVFAPQRLMKAGHVLALDDYMERDGLRPDEFCSLFQERNMLDGRVYSLPIMSNIWAMMYNKDLFAAADLPELTVDSVISYNDWLEYARAVNQPADTFEERIWGSVTFPPRWNSMNNHMSDPFVLGADGRSCTGNSESEDWVNAWTMLQTAYSEDLTPDTAGTLGGNTAMEDLFLQGKVGMTYATLGDAIAARRAGLNVGLTGQPVITPGWEHNVGGWNVAYSIMARSSHPDEAWEFLHFLATELAVELADLENAGEVGGIPCYLPLNDEYLAAKNNDPFVSDAIALSARIEPSPFTPDVWGSTASFDEAWRRMTEEGEIPAVAIQDAAAECQAITDELWQDWEQLGE